MGRLLMAVYPRREQGTLPQDIRDLKSSGDEMKAKTTILIWKLISSNLFASLFFRSRSYYTRRAS
jgi:hypothetical protein